MCRLFAMTGGPLAVGATFWLLDADDSLARQSAQNADGTGVGWFEEDGTPSINKEPVEAKLVDDGLRYDVRAVRARTFIAHIRYATSTAKTTENTHPFLLDGRMFGHNGIVGDLDAVDERLGDDAARVLGDADSERFFALITKEIAAAGGDERAGIIAAVQWLANEVEMYSLNFVMVTATDVWALRYPDKNTLYLLDRRSAKESPKGHPFATSIPSPGIGVSAPDTANQATVVIASQPLNGDNWEAIEPGELIHVAHDLTITREVIIDHDPVHMMVLGGQAAAAQGLS